LDADRKKEWTQMSWQGAVARAVSFHWQKGKNQGNILCYTNPLAMKAYWCPQGTDTKSHSGREIGSDIREPWKM